MNSSSCGATGWRRSRWIAQYNPVGRDRIVFTVPRLDDLQYDPTNPDVDIMPDGEHFVFGLGNQSSAATNYGVVINRFEELKQKRSSR